MDYRAVLEFATVTRGLSLFLQALLNAAIPDHDADAFRPPRTEEHLYLDSAVEWLFGGLTHWDAEHFLLIAERGYIYEHNFAFFPFFPVVLRGLAETLLWPLSSWLSVRGRLMVAVAVGNSIFFLLSVVALHALSREVLQDRRLALLSTLLYCITPANVFMVAGYSECLFAALTFSGVFLLEKGFTLRACVALSIATAARSNGLVNIGFILYLPTLHAISRIRLYRATTKGHKKMLQYIWVVTRLLLTSLLGTAIIALPFCAFQYYGYRTFCMPSASLERIPAALLSLAERKGYRVPDENSPPPLWCMRPLPLLYSHIQDVYWNVGFLRYFELRQIPNFLLALPMVTLGVMAAFAYFQGNPELCLRLGLWETDSKKGLDKPMPGFFSPRVFVYVVHSTFLLAFGILCMHVQVLTRFMASSTPVPYWISAHLLLLNEPLLHRRKTSTPNIQLKTHSKNGCACFWRWEEAGVPGGNPRSHGENMQTPHRKIPSPGLNSGPSYCEAHALTPVPPCCPK
ncbi:palmitoyltransferase ZDHHC18-A isoform X1 [Entelurus aequoreus]|uniref:palmitoyltransferase ZDHHC18-A isoform X1 n=1 Tax=Entelurus aequoreus TaxID=161455 RepID=UPI002B1DB03B|nr:palmitoyltransferase ZDHHC18-A isoform X1 [Entelurus aequoreus]